MDRFHEDGARTALDNSEVVLRDRSIKFAGELKWRGMDTTQRLWPPLVWWDTQELSAPKNASQVVNEINTPVVCGERPDRNISVAYRLGL
jgi:hypothetical protein